MRRLTLSLLLSASSAFVLASPSYLDIGSYGGYATALAGYGTGFSDFLGDNLETSMVETGKHAANWNSFTSGTASVTADFSDSTLTGHGFASGGMGVFHLGGTTSGFNSTFRYGGGSGGWSDTWTINKAGLAGTAGVLDFSINVDGTLTATGVTGLGDMGVEIYKDSLHGPSVNYQVTDLAGSGVLSVADDPAFSVSFTYGKAFTLGVFMEAYGGSRAEGPPIAISSGSADFTHTITWGGITNILDASNNVVSGYSVTSASGINWQPAATPEPAPFVAFGVGLLALARRRRA